MVFVLGVIGWITQLIVEASRHRRYHATMILCMLRDHPLFTNINVVGLAASHPAACDALVKYACKYIYIYTWNIVIK
jgi:hypothetical protein